MLMAWRRQLVSAAAMLSTGSSLQQSRCLLIHGKGESGSKMLTQFGQRIAPALPEIYFDAVTAPHTMANQDQYQWWLLPPGERSFTASEYKGLDQSLDTLAHKASSEEPFDIVWGHSQGAIFLAFLLARRDLLDTVFASRTPTLFVLNGAAWPQPFDADLRSLEEQAQTFPKTLHCFATDDPINPSEQARRISSLFDGDSFVHEGGHYVPDDPQAIAAYRSFLLP